MFNIDETRREAVLQRRLELLRRAYQDGFFDEEGTIPISQLVADGENPPAAPQQGIGAAARRREKQT